MSIESTSTASAEKYFFRASATDFKKIPGSPIAYWFSQNELNAFTNAPVSENLESEGAVKTGNNDLYVRLLWEVSRTKISIGGPWRKHPKGGGFRKWYGNLDAIVRWDELTRKHYRDDHISRIPTEEIWDIEGITWTAVSSSILSFRFEEADEIANNAALFIYPKSNDRINYYIGLLNSKTSRVFLKAISPTLNYLVGDVLSVPDVTLSDTARGHINQIVETSISLARLDWDNLETSWGFQNLPLLREGLKAKTLFSSWHNWDHYCRSNITRMKQLEEENNRLWIDAYGLQDELTPEVPEEEITLARADPRNDMAAFISYAIGCMLGRYSLDKPGLILANAGEKNEDYYRLVGDEGGSGQGAGNSEETAPSSLNPVSSKKFHPDEDNIIPILDAEWFNDDIVERFKEFLRVTFGEDTLRENIQFIEDSLGKDLRKYFVTDFYKDHLKTYKKRPIYWLFQSPKKSFQALIYLHRYNRDTVSLLLNDYLREFQNKLRNRRQHLNEVLASESTSARDKTAATKEQTKIDKSLTELADWERDVILPLAQQRLEIDLDDGVKQNYPKFGKALAKVAGLS